MRYLPLWILLGLVPAASAQTGTFAVDAQTRSLNLQPHMLHLPDREHALGAQAALASGLWRPLPGSNLGYRNYPVWTRITLHSTDGRAHRFILYNPRPGTNRLDVHILDSEERAEHQLGTFRPAANHVLRHRYTGLPLTVPADRPITILTRVSSAGPLEVGWMLSTIGEFSEWSIGENLVRGLVGGAILTMVLYNLMLWVNLRQPLLLAYVAFGATMLLTVFSFQGVYRVFSFGLPPIWFFYGTWVFAALMSVTMIAIGMHFFDTRAHMPRMHRWLKTLLVGLAVNFAWIVVAIGHNDLFRFTPAMHLLLLIIYLSLIATAVAGLRMKLTGSTYYLAGHGSLLAALIWTSAVHMGWVGSFATVWVIVPAGALLDVAFLAKAIGQRLGRMKDELELQREHALVQSRFASLGKTIGMIAHQWRAPLARQGAVLTEMEMLLESEKAGSLPRLQTVLLPRLQESLAMLNGTVADFRAMFAADNKTRRFDPADIIDQTLALISWQRHPDSLELHWRRPEERVILDSHPATLAHVLMILVENAVDILIERDVANPVLSISLHRRGSDVCISAADNGGGIRVEPIERIFSGFYSAKQRQGSGMGLYIARMLVEERLQGRIEAENTAQGARLRLVLPVMDAP